MKKVTYEMQGPEIVPEDMEDKVFVRNEAGELVELDIPDDPDEEEDEEEC